MAALFYAAGLPLAVVTAAREGRWLRVALQAAVIAVVSLLLYRQNKIVRALLLISIVVLVPVNIWEVFRHWPSASYLVNLATVIAFAGWVLLLLWHPPTRLRIQIAACMFVVNWSLALWHALSYTISR
jgi:glucose-6-phosphate-specific signal transduction histidine kinase